MPTTMCFSQSCPTCGRMLSISVRLIGRKVACQHCQREFQATHSDRDANTTAQPPELPLLARADELLRRANAMIG